MSDNKNTVVWTYTGAGDLSGVGPPSLMDRSLGVLSPILRKMDGVDFDQLMDEWWSKPFEFTIVQTIEDGMATFTGTSDQDDMKGPVVVLAYCLHQLATEGGGELTSVTEGDD